MCFKVYETPSGCRGIPQCLSLRSTQTIRIRLSGRQGVAEIPVFCVLQLSGFSCHSGSVGFCCLHSKQACGLAFPQRLCFELRGLPPLSLIIAFGSAPWQEMRDLFYLAWTTLFLPDYWCYFTLNNMTLCSQSAQGQSLRVIDTFKSRGGDYNQREGVCEERI